MTRQPIKRQQFFPSIFPCIIKIFFLPVPVQFPIPSKAVMFCHSLQCFFVCRFVCASQFLHQSKMTHVNTILQTRNTTEEQNEEMDRWCAVPRDGSTFGSTPTVKMADVIVCLHFVCVGSRAKEGRKQCGCLLNAILTVMVFLNKIIKHAHPLVNHLSQEHHNSTTFKNDSQNQLTSENNVVNVCHHNPCVSSATSKNIQPHPNPLPSQIREKGSSSGSHIAPA